MPSVQLADLAAALAQGNGEGVVDEECAGEDEDETRKLQRLQHSAERPNRAALGRAGNRVLCAEIGFKFVAGDVLRLIRLEPDEDGGDRAGRFKTSLHRLQRHPCDRRPAKSAGLFEQANDHVLTYLLSSLQCDCLAHTEGALQSPACGQEHFGRVGREEFPRTSVRMA
jgi:hypothetical protein